MQPSTTDVALARTFSESQIKFSARNLFVYFAQKNVSIIYSEGQADLAVWLKNKITELNSFNDLLGFLQYFNDYLSPSLAQVRQYLRLLGEVDEGKAERVQAQLIEQFSLLQAFIAELSDRHGDLSSLLKGTNPDKLLTQLTYSASESLQNEVKRILQNRMDEQAQQIEEKQEQLANWQQKFSEAMAAINSGSVPAEFASQVSVLSWRAFLLKLPELLGQYNLVHEGVLWKQLQQQPDNCRAWLHCLLAQPQIQEALPEIANCERIINFAENLADKNSFSELQGIVLLLSPPEITTRQEGDKCLLLVEGGHFAWSDILNLPPFQEDSLSKIDEVHFLSKGVMFADANLDQARWGGINLLACYKKIQITKNIVIDLSGHTARELCHQTADHGSTVSGYSTGMNGKDGLAGNPGQASGRAYFLGDMVAGGDLICWQLNGGQGGDGQNGGNGGDGISGNDGRDGERHTLGWYAYSQDQPFYDYGKPGRHGTVGGNGGDGGAGGQGGYAGELIFKDANHDYTALYPNNLHAEPGANGKAGKAGCAGAGGYNGRNGADAATRRNGWFADDSYALGRGFYHFVHHKGWFNCKTYYTVTPIVPAHVVHREARRQLSAGHYGKQKATIARNAAKNLAISLDEKAQMYLHHVTSTPLVQNVGLSIRLDQATKSQNAILSCETAMADFVAEADKLYQQYQQVEVMCQTVNQQGQITTQQQTTVTQLIVPDIFLKRDRATEQSQQGSESIFFPIANSTDPAVRWEIESHGAFAKKILSISHSSKIVEPLLRTLNLIAQWEKQFLQTGRLYFLSSSMRCRSRYRRLLQDIVAYERVPEQLVALAMLQATLEQKEKFSQMDLVTKNKNLKIAFGKFSKAIMGNSQDERSEQALITFVQEIINHINQFGHYFNGKDYFEIFDSLTLGVQKIPEAWRDNTKNKFGMVLFCALTDGLVDLSCGSMLQCLGEYSTVASIDQFKMVLFSFKLSPFELDIIQQENVSQSVELAAVFEQYFRDFYLDSRQQNILNLTNELTPGVKSYIQNDFEQFFDWLSSRLTEPTSNSYDYRQQQAEALIRCLRDHKEDPIQLSERIHELTEGLNRLANSSLSDAEEKASASEEKFYPEETQSLLESFMALKFPIENLPPESEGGQDKLWSKLRKIIDNKGLKFWGSKKAGQPGILEIVVSRINVFSQLPSLESVIQLFSWISARQDANALRSDLKRYSCEYWANAILYGNLLETLKNFLLQQSDCSDSKSVYQEAKSKLTNLFSDLSILSLLNNKLETEVSLSIPKLKIHWLLLFETIKKLGGVDWRSASQALQQELALSSLFEWSVILKKHELLQTLPPALDEGFDRERTAILLCNFQEQFGEGLTAAVTQKIKSYQEVNYKPLADLFFKIMHEEFVLDEVVAKRLEQSELSYWQNILSDYTAAVYKKPRDLPEFLRLMQACPANKGLQDIPLLKQQIEQIHRLITGSSVENELSIKLGAVNQNRIKDWRVADIRFWIGKLRQEANSKELIQAHLPEVMAVISQAIYLSYGFYPWDTQYLAVLAAINGDHAGAKRILEDIKTGQGKTLISAMVAIVQALGGALVDIISSSSVLAKEGMDECRKLINLFGLSVACSSGDYGDFDIKLMAGSHESEESITTVKQSHVVVAKEIPGDYVVMYLSSANSGFVSKTTVNAKSHPKLKEKLDKLPFQSQSCLVGDEIHGEIETIVRAHKGYLCKKTWKDRLRDSFRCDIRYSDMETTILAILRTVFFGEKLTSNRYAYLIIDEIDTLINKIKEIFYLSHDILELSYLDHLLLACWAEAHDRFPDPSDLPQLLESIKARLFAGHMQAADLCHDGIQIPEALQKFVQANLPSWAQGVYIAKRMPPDCQYIFEESDWREGRQIHLIDPEGIASATKSLDAGVQSYLNWKHQNASKPLSLKALFMSPFALVMSHYPAFLGMSGTAPIYGFDGGFFQSLFQIDRVVVIPRYDPIRVTVDLPEVFASEAELVSAVAKITVTKAQSDQPSLVIAPTIAMAKEVFAACERYSSMSAHIDTRLYSYQTATVGTKEHPLASNCVLISTPLSGRGWDFKADAAATPEILTMSVFANMRTAKQVQGRGSRGRDASCFRMMAFDRDASSVEALMWQRDREDGRNLEDIRINFLPYNNFIERLFDQFKKLSETVEISLQATPYGEDEKYLGIQRKALRTHWAFFLNEIEIKIKSSRARDEVAIFSMFDSFSEKMKSLANDGGAIGLAAHLGELHELGKYFFYHKHKDELALNCYDQATQFYPEFAECVLNEKAIVFAKQAAEAGDDFSKRLPLVKAIKQLLKVLDNRIYQHQVDIDKMCIVEKALKTSGQGLYFSEYKRSVDGILQALLTQRCMLENIIGVRAADPVFFAKYIPLQKDATHFFDTLISNFELKNYRVSKKISVDSEGNIRINAESGPIIICLPSELAYYREKITTLIRERQGAEQRERTLTFDQLCASLSGGKIADLNKEKQQLINLAWFILIQSGVIKPPVYKGNRAHLTSYRHSKRASEEQFYALAGSARTLEKLSSTVALPIADFLEKGSISERELFSLANTGLFDVVTLSQKIEHWNWDYTLHLIWGGIKITGGCLLTTASGGLAVGAGIGLITDGVVEVATLLGDSFEGNDISKKPYGLSIAISYSGQEPKERTSKQIFIDAAKNVTARLVAEKIVPSLVAGINKTEFIQQVKKDLLTHCQIGLSDQRDVVVKIGLRIGELCETAEQTQRMISLILNRVLRNYKRPPIQLESLSNRPELAFNAQRFRETVHSAYRNGQLTGNAWLDTLCRLSVEYFDQIQAATDLVTLPATLLQKVYEELSYAHETLLQESTADSPSTSSPEQREKLGYWLESRLDAWIKAVHDKTVNHFLTQIFNPAIYHLVDFGLQRGIDCVGKISQRMQEKRQPVINKQRPSKILVTKQCLFYPSGSGLDLFALKLAAEKGIYSPQQALSERIVSKNNEFGVSPHLIELRNSESLTLQESLPDFMRFPLNNLGLIVAGSCLRNAAIKRQFAVFIPSQISHEQIVGVTIPDWMLTLKPDEIRAKIELFPLAKDYLEYQNILPTIAQMQLFFKQFGISLMDDPRYKASAADCVRLLNGASASLEPKYLPIGIRAQLESARESLHQLTMNCLMALCAQRFSKGVDDVTVVDMVRLATDDNLPIYKASSLKAKKAKPFKFKKIPVAKNSGCPNEEWYRVEERSVLPKNICFFEPAVLRERDMLSCPVSLAGLAIPSLGDEIEALESTIADKERLLKRPTIEELSQAKQGCLTAARGREYFEQMGGRVRDNKDCFYHTCSIRLSERLNNIPTKEIPFLADKTVSYYKQATTEKSWAYYRVMDLLDYFSKTYGDPIVIRTASEEHVLDKSKGLFIYLFGQEGEPAGHAGVYEEGDSYRDPMGRRHWIWNPAAADGSATKDVLYYWPCLEQAEYDEQQTVLSKLRESLKMKKQERAIEANRPGILNLGNGFFAPEKADEAKIEEPFVLLNEPSLSRAR